MPKHAIEVKWMFWALLSWIALAAGLVWCLFYIFLNSQYTFIGKTVDCVTRPSPMYLQKFCDIEADGPACHLETRNRLVIWNESIDAACAKFEPDRAFVFKTYSEPEAIEVASSE